MGKVGNSQTFSVGAGDLTAHGHRLDRLFDTELAILEDATLNIIDQESQVFVDSGGGDSVITLNHSPIAAVTKATVVKTSTEQLTRSVLADDPIGVDSVFEIIDVTQGATTFIQDTDYSLVGDKVHWITGENQPTSGQSFDVEILYREDVIPSLITDTQITLQGGVIGTEAQITYTVKLPRIDAIAIDRQGNISYVRGSSPTLNPRAPQVPATDLVLCHVINDWFGAPQILDKRIMNRSYQEQQAHAELTLKILDNQNELFSLHDIQANDPAKARTSFIDHFSNDDQRDAGLSQNASISEGALRLGMDLFGKTATAFCRTGN